MGWYSSAFKRRIAVTIDAIGAGGGGGGPVDIEINNISSRYDSFWANIRSDGLDIVVTDRDGTKATFKRSSFNYPDRLLTLQIDGMHIEDKSSINVCWIYFDNPNQTLDLASAFTVSTPLTGYAHEGAPTGFIVAPTRNTAIANQPLTTFIKDPSEIVDIWFSTAGLFEMRRTPSNGRNILDDPSYIEVESLTSGGVDAAGRYIYSQTKAIDGWVKVRVQAGDDGADYSVRCIINSNAQNVYILSCLLKVKKLLPEA